MHNIAARLMQYRHAAIEHTIRKHDVMFHKNQKCTKYCNAIRG